MAQPDVLIVGGGVIGAAIAYHLAEAGTRVVVLERGRAGGHASLASAGLLHPHLNAGVSHPVRELSLASFALYPNLVARLRELTGIDPEYQTPGFRAEMDSGPEHDAAVADKGGLPVWIFLTSVAITHLHRHLGEVDLLKDLLRQEGLR